MTSLLRQSMAEIDEAARFRPLLRVLGYITALSTIQTTKGHTGYAVILLRKLADRLDIKARGSSQESIVPTKEISGGGVDQRKDFHNCAHHL